MAKKVQISADSGANWFTLPGSSGELSREAAQVDDTIFGQTFESKFPSILSWNVNADAIYKGFAGYLATLKKQGSSTTMTAEGMTLLTGKTYQVTLAARQIWDRATAVTVFDNGVDQTANVESIDYLFGKVTFLTAYSVTGPVTATGKYFPTAVLGKAQTYGLTQTAAVIDTTDFASAQANGGFLTSDPGLRNADLELAGFFDSVSDFSTELQARNELIVEINPTGTGDSIARGFYRLVSAAQQGDVGALEEETLSFALSVPANAAIPFGWAYASSYVLPEAIKLLQDAWANETKIDVQYLYDGLVGEKGTAVVTDISLAGDLSGQNEFSVSLMGDGALSAAP